MYSYGVDAYSDNFKVERIGINKEKKTMIVNINTKELGLFLKGLKEEYFIAIEAITNSFWFYDLVKNKVKDCYVVNP